MGIMGNFVPPKLKLHKSIPMKKLSGFILLFTVTLFMQHVVAQNEKLKPVVQYPVYFDVSPPLRDVAKQQLNTQTSWKEKEGKREVENIFRHKTNPTPEELSSMYSDPARQDNMGQVQTDTTIQNFDGNTNTEGYVPPDIHGDVGPNHYFQVVNCHYSIYNKSGVKLIGPLASSSMWSGLPNNSNDGDAVVLYDEQADRWIFSQFSLPTTSGPFYQMIAVSQTGDPTGTWYRWEYSFTNMGDYPKFGIWPDGYYMAVNRFNGSGTTYYGTGAYAFNRTQMIAGNASPAMISFTLGSSNEAYAFLPADCDGPFPTTGTPEYFAYINDNPDHMVIYEFHADWANTANSTFTSTVTLPVTTFSSFTASAVVSQKNATQKLDALSDRFMYRLQYRKFNDHAAMVTNHTVNAGSNVCGIRWYELRNTGSGWSIYQQSTYSPDATSRWMASIAMDTAQTIAMSYSVSSSTMFPAIRYCGRLKNDPLNTMSIAERGIMNGGGSQTGANRWGDYSAISCDPSQGGVFWATHEYYSSTSSVGWKTRIASFSFGNIMTVHATATPSTINIGQNSQLDVTATGGSGTYTYSWTSVPAGYTSAIKNPVVSPVNSTKYIAHVNDGTQTKTDTTQVLVTLAVVATATPDTVNAGQSTQLHATPSGGSGTYSYVWTSIPAGFNSILQNPTVSPTQTTQYIVQASDNAQIAKDTVQVVVNLAPMTVNATATPTALCLGQTTQLDVTATGGTGNYTYSWSSIPAGFTSTQKNPTAQPMVNTEYIASVNDGSQTKKDTTLMVVISDPASAFAGNDTTVCTYNLTIPVQGTAANYSSPQWTTSGNGTFQNPQSLNTLYTFGTTEKALGYVNLTLTVNSIYPCTSTPFDSRHIVLDPCTGIPGNGSANFAVSVRPNPTEGEFTLTVKGASNQEVSVSIVNMVGQKVMDLKFDSGNELVKAINMGEFPKGPYFIRVNTKDHMAMEKLILH
jgi:hypothetical protein